MEPYCGREGTISRQFPSGDIRVRFGEPVRFPSPSVVAEQTVERCGPYDPYNPQGAIWAGVEWTYNPLAVRLAGDVPFAPLTLRDAAVGQRVRVSRDQVRVMDGTRCGRRTG